MRTPLHAAHLRLGARIVDFHGWEMPIQYAGIIQEHTATRTAAGLFDLSHMGRIWISGRDRRAYLQKLLTVDVEAMAAGRCRYAFLLTEQGTVIDDLLVYEDSGRDRSFLVVNASNREKDLEWMRGVSEGFSVAIEDVTIPTALIAIQGPRCLEVMKGAFDLDPSGLKYYTFGTFPVLGDPDCLVSRTGYTGEDGFEVFVKAENAGRAWEAALAGGAAAGIRPVGLGARDTLRIEAGMPLYGQELDDRTTPLEAGQGFALALNKAGFIGRDALRRQEKSGPARKLVGFHMEGSRVPRPGMPIYVSGDLGGTVTSGTFSPSLQKPVGMGYVPAAQARQGEAIEIDVRGRREKAGVVRLPFYKRPK